MRLGGLPLGFLAVRFLRHVVRAVLLALLLLLPGLLGHFGFPERQAVLGLVHALVLVEDERDPGGVIPVGVLQGGGGVQLPLGALDENGPVGRGHGHAPDVRVQEALLAVRPDLVVLLRRRGLLLLAARVLQPGQAWLGSRGSIVVQAREHLGEPVGGVRKQVVLLVLQVQGVERAAEHARGCTVVREHRRRWVMLTIFILCVGVAQIGWESRGGAQEVTIHLVRGIRRQGPHVARVRPGSAAAEGVPLHVLVAVT